MPLFESNYPYVNQHGLNLDWILKKIKDFETQVAQFQEQLTAFGNQLEGFSTELATMQTALNTAVLDISDLKTRVATNEGDISGLKTRVTTIEETLSSIGTSITNLTNEIQRVEAESVSRDNNLGNRVSLLESAVINPIDIYNASENMILAGDYLLGLPVPSGMKNPYNVNQDNNSWSYDQYGFYPTETWQNLDFNTTYTVPTSGGGHQLSHAITVTTVFMTKTNEVASAYNVANPSFWVVDSKTFTSADALQELSIEGIYVDVRPEGTIRVHNRAGDQTNGWRLVAIKAEKGETASGINLNNRDQRLMDFAINYGGAGSTPTHYTGSYTMNVDSLDTDPEITWADSPYFTVSVDLYKVGNIVQGSIKFVLGSGQTEAITMSNLVTTAKNLNVSALGLPATKTPGAAIGSYNDILNREQYLVYGANTSNTLTSMNVFPYFVSKTTASDGTIVEIPIAYVC